MPLNALLSTHINSIFKNTIDSIFILEIQRGCTCRCEFIRIGLRGIVKNANKFAPTLKNLQQRYTPLVDVWLHFDNAGDTPTLIDWSEQ